MFDRVVLINLKRRPDRLAAFRSAQSALGWPLPEPLVLDAVDGNVVGVPRDFIHGGGAWGCCRSHVLALERAVMDGVGTLLVLEDDLSWGPDLGPDLARFLAEVPPDWDQLMLGGQHMSRPAPVPGRPGVVRVRKCQRTHAYAVRGRATRSLLGLWYRATTHIDHAMGSWQAGWNVYSPEPFLFGQGGGPSDISGRLEPPRTWSTSDYDRPLLYLDVPPAVARHLRDRGVHTGYDRDPETGYDRGLMALAADPGRRVANLRRWLAVVGREAASVPGGLAAVWHPEIPEADVVEAFGETPVVVRAVDLEGARRTLPAGYGARTTYAHGYVAHLTAPRPVLEQLREAGWHPGNWRDERTGYDHGLRRAASLPDGSDARRAALAAWVETVSREAETIRGGVAVCWHPAVGPDELAAAAGGRTVVAVSAAGAPEAREILEGLTGG